MKNYDDLGEQQGSRVVRCHGCNKVQFLSKSCKCKVCKVSLGEIMEAAQVQPVEPERKFESTLNIAGAVRACREAQNLSQSDVAARMNVPRTYISKIENQRCIPTLNLLDRMCSAFNLPVSFFLQLCEVRGL